jgi:1-acyl-sn-glycerol-3-phosphate acyltransferase
MTDSVAYRWSPKPGLYRTTRALVGPLVERFFRMRITGAEHVPADGAVVLACNHLSNLDPVLLAAACPRRINYLAKVELFRVPLLGRLIRSYGAIPLRRTASDPDALRLTEMVLEHGELLALFPEGTRSRDGQLRPFRFGAARMALKHNVPLVPAAILGTDRAMPAGSKLPRRVPISIAFGAPLDIAEYRYRETGATPESHALEVVTARLETAVRQLQERLGAEHGAPALTGVQQ